MMDKKTIEQTVDRLRSLLEKKRYPCTLTVLPDSDPRVNLASVKRGTYLRVDTKIPADMARVREFFSKMNCWCCWLDQDSHTSAIFFLEIFEKPVEPDRATGFSFRRLQVGDRLPNGQTITAERHHITRGRELLVNGCWIGEQSIALSS